MRNAIHFLGGSIAVYLLMAACSAGTKTKVQPGPGQQAATGGAAAQGAAAAAGATGGSPAAGGAEPGTGGIIGEMMDPVPDAEAAPATSGTRLRARYYTGEDGSRQFVGWRDSQRNEDCSFARAEDGVTRCIPAISAYGSSYFADAGCTQPFAITASTATACGGATPVVPKYLADLAAAGCGVTKLFKVGAAAAPAMVYSGSPAACTAAAPPAYSYYSTTHAPAAEFVAATEQVE